MPGHPSTAAPQPAPPHAHAHAHAHARTRTHTRTRTHRWQASASLAAQPPGAKPRCVSESPNSSTRNLGERSIAAARSALDGEGGGEQPDLCTMQYVALGSDLSDAGWPARGAFRTSRFGPLRLFFLRAASPRYCTCTRRRPPPRFAASDRRLSSQLPRDVAKTALYLASHRIASHRIASHRARVRAASHTVRADVAQLAPLGPAAARCCGPATPACRAMAQAEGSAAVRAAGAALREADAVLVLAGGVDAPAPWRRCLRLPPRRCWRQDHARLLSGLRLVNPNV